MKRRRIGKATAAGIVAGVMAVFGVGCNDNATVYGPPEMLDPSLNMNDEVYGPPEMLDPSYDGGEDGSAPLAEDPDATDKWAVPLDEASNMNQMTYGPPPMPGAESAGFPFFASGTGAGGTDGVGEAADATGSNGDAISSFWD